MTATGVKRSAACVCDAVCMCVCQFVRMITQKKNDPKVFKLGVENKPGISSERYDFWVKRSKVKPQINKVQKHIEDDRVQARVMHSIECPSQPLGMDAMI